jgi:hypothetical protein
MYEALGTTRVCGLKLQRKTFHLKNSALTEKLMQIKTASNGTSESAW